MLSPTVLLLPLLILRTIAQCVTPGYELCAIPGSQDTTITDPALALAGESWRNTLSSQSISVMAMGAESFAAAAGVRAVKRQDLSALCCPPAPVQCMYTEEIAFCYVSCLAEIGSEVNLLDAERITDFGATVQDPDTTCAYFPDGSYMFDSNSTFYGVDGTIIDYKKGVAQYPNGTTENFTPEEDSSSSDAPSSDSSSDGSGGLTASSSSSSPVSSSSTPAVSSFSQASTRASNGASTSATTTFASGSQIAFTVSSGVLASNAFLGRIFAGAVGVLGLLAWI
ncbi:hypothetical protein LTR56_024033 [Elasticomyces elasticus]|nr:hypothetical protein LTR56_024033 [Elasticomyces elasticus]KAK4908439.1 hypothetical protein LTR49_022645 [Elasticomyces elasticus]KAK5743180.1 hypothetical protein LTS12_023953 [Elasticomyces elasticus]